MYDDLRNVSKPVSPPVRICPVKAGGGHGVGAAAFRLDRLFQESWINTCELQPYNNLRVGLESDTPLTARSVFQRLKCDTLRSALEVPNLRRTKRPTQIRQIAWTLRLHRPNALGGSERHRSIIREMSASAITNRWLKSTLNRITMHSELVFVELSSRRITYLMQKHPLFSCS